MNTGCIVRYGEPEICYPVTITHGKDEVTGTLLGDSRSILFYGDDDYSSPIDEMGIDKDVVKKIDIPLQEYFSELILLDIKKEG